MTPAAAHAALRQAALAYPDAYPETPWGEEVMKVRRKVFVFVGLREGALSLTVKLPDSRYAALGLEFTAPTGYGLGKSGWVTSRFGPGEEVPIDLLREWLDESYRAVAPKKLVKQLDAGAPAPAPAPAPAQRSGAVLLVGEDPARLERAGTALEACGLTVDSADYVTAGSVDGARDLVVVDLSRRFEHGLAWVRRLRDGGVLPGPVVFTGVRDRRSADRVKAALPGRPAYRHAPGEPSMIAALLTHLD